ncbi:MAG: mannose-1-phosphate guanylyltransferase/mannose-6-phosphate isomerase [Pseudomonadota bacterium]
MTEIYPILLCGGSGQRLWPLSRKTYPKQFLELLGPTTPFQAAAQRVAGGTFAPPTVMTAAEFRFLAAEQLLAVGVDPRAILIEPEIRDTAPAVLAAALHVAQDAADALLLVLPCDHAIKDTGAFLRAVEAGRVAAEAGRLVTFGVTPTRPETGYGYLEPSEPPCAMRATPLSSFVEKPDRSSAEGLLASGRHLWNSGIFLFRAADIIAAFEHHAQELCKPVRRAVAKAKPDLGFLRLDREAYAQAPATSLDFAVLEAATNLAVVKFDGEWSDLGGWDAIWKETGPDRRGVATAGDATAIDCRDTLLRSESDGLALVGLGLEGVVAIAMPDAVLVADASRSQDLKDVVARMKAQGAPQAERFPVDHRPWGSFESLVTGPRFQVKRLSIRPGAALSLQSHRHRSEHWTVVEGKVRVTLGTDTWELVENQSAYIPVGARHRLENPGDVPAVIIEVQTGTYFGEDDIIRYEDRYARRASPSKEEVSAVEVVELDAF